MSLPGKLQRAFIYERRLRRLAELLAQTIPKSYGVLDVGSGDGRLAWSLMQRRSDLAIQGVDVMMRPATQIPVKLFDGTTLPYPNSSFDAVMLIDVLHHTVDPFRLLREALRVCRNCLIVKDHLLEGFAAGLRLRILDYAGNADHGVALPYNYMSVGRIRNASAGKGDDQNQKVGPVSLAGQPGVWGRSAVPRPLCEVRRRCPGWRSGFLTLDSGSQSFIAGSAPVTIRTHQDARALGPTGRDGASRYSFP